MPEIRTEEVKYWEGIKRYREEILAIDQDAAAAMVGMERSQYCKIENGKGNPTYFTLQKIAEKFGTKVSAFFSKEPRINNITGNNNNNNFENGEVNITNEVGYMDKVEKLQEDRYQALKDEIDVLKERINEIKSQKNELKNENDIFKKENIKLKNEIVKLRKLNGRLKD